MSSVEKMKSMALKFCSPMLSEKVYQRDIRLFPVMGLAVGWIIKMSALSQ